ncbi:unnamed protein product [Anisakis simplex]|uniref:ShKT domain-containing protein n=1 Tax=Anisakis simplex TaxID=6269 RepID=A0A0M3KA81_ANISI|nr:unnamed protein product [Anisakis simplex]
MHAMTIVPLLLVAAAVYVASDDECKDTAKSCRTVKKNGKCELEAAKRVCRSTCGHCDTPAPEPKADTEDCADTWADCEMDLYVCGSQKSALSSCKKTCETCDSK